MLKSVSPWCVGKISVNCILSVLLTVNRCSFDVWAIIKCQGEVVNLFVVHFPEIRLICSQCSDGRLFSALAVPARRCYKFDIKFNFSGFRSRTFILFDFTLHRQLVC